MKTRLKTKALARVAGAALLLSAALTAWGINITLNDGTNSVTCAITDITTIDPNGDINTTVNPGTTCDLSGGGGGDPPPGGPFTLTVNKTGTGSGTVSSTPAGINNCSATCNASFTDGTSVSLNPNPATGSTFTNWSGACTGTGPCILSMTANRSVTASFAADPPQTGACGALPAGVVVVDTGNMTSAFAKRTYTPASPSTVYAFKVTMNAGYTGNSAVNATVDVSSPRTKLLVVSQCPGVLTLVEPTGCEMVGTNVSTVKMSGNQSAPSYVCKLPNSTTTDYYVNAVSKDSYGNHTCTSSANCAFAFDRSGGG